MLPNCSAGENSSESFEQQEDQTSQSQTKSTLNTHWTDSEVKAPILRPPDAKSQLIGKDPDAGKN